MPYHCISLDFCDTPRQIYWQHIHWAKAVNLPFVLNLHFVISEGECLYTMFTMKSSIYTSEHCISFSDYSSIVSDRHTDTQTDS